MKEKNDFSQFIIPLASNSGVKPSSFWYLVPFLFAILGGIIGYAAVKDDDRGMAKDLLLLGWLMSFVNFFVIWLSLFVVNFTIICLSVLVN